MRIVTAQVVIGARTPSSATAAYSRRGRGGPRCHGMRGTAWPEQLPRIPPSKGNSGSLLIIVLWIVLGLVTITLYFANSMNFEMRAADNTVRGLAADQAIEGGARYVAAVLTEYATNGAVPNISDYQSEAVPVGDAHFWLIGRAGDYQSQMQPDQVFFGLIDENSKLNLNTVTTNLLYGLTNMSPELAANIVDWRDTNGATSDNGDGPSMYSTIQPGYSCKNAPYETVDELRLVYPTDMGILFGEDFNLNGVLDPGEADTNRNGVVDPGLLEYVTVYSREPNTGRISINPVDTSGLTTLLQTNLDSSRASQIISALIPPTGGAGPSAGRQAGAGAGGATAGGGAAGGGAAGGATAGGANPGAGATAPTFVSPLQFYMQSGMTSDEFASISHYITAATNGDFVIGRINIDTASPAVLACLPGLIDRPDLVQQLITYREQNPDKLTSVAWVVDALGQNNQDALTSLAAGDYITTESYQFTADIAAVGPFGRGYRRVKFIFDMSSGTPQIIYRQDLSHLGWALGKYVRQTWLLAQNTQ
jgi:type II secretory pathway component PulK